MGPGATPGFHNEPDTDPALAPNREWGRRILARVPEGRRTHLVSATFPPAFTAGNTHVLFMATLDLEDATELAIQFGFGNMRQVEIDAHPIVLDAQPFAVRRFPR